MSRAHILDILKHNAKQLKAQFGLRRLSLFGSAARDEMSNDSDVDVLIEFVDAPTFDKYMDLKFLLEELLQTSVDLVTKDAVKPRMLPYIEKDLIDVS